MIGGEYFITREKLYVQIILINYVQIVQII